MRRRLGPLLALLALGAMAVAACGDDDGGADGQVVDATFERFDGSTASVADYRGRPVVVNFFSSTCEPCETEMPAFEAVHQELGDQVVFLGLAVQDTVESGLRFVEKVGVTWELGRDPSAQILQGLGGTGLPTTVLLDEDGRIVFLRLGTLDAGELEGQIRTKLLA